MKYKLVKTYPGSPKLNTVIDDEITTFGVSFAKNNLNSIENHSEFWKPIIEKNYEILSYCENKNIFHIKDNSEILHRLNFKIHSVKRLSDGEI